MARNKEQDKKDFFIAKRKSVGAGVTNAPVWVLQKAGKRIWNKKQKRHWRDTNLGKEFERSQGKQGKVYNEKRVKSGWKKRDKKNRDKRKREKQ